MNLSTTERESKSPSTGVVRQLGPLGILCLLAGSRWLLDEALPSARSSYFSAGVGCLVAGAAVLAWKRVLEPGGRAGSAVPKRRTYWKFPILAALVLCSPGLSGAAAKRHLNASAATVALALTPIVAAVSVAASGTGGEMAGLLWPGLAGIAGLLLLLPEPDLSLWRTDVALAAMPLLSGVAASLLTSRDTPLHGGDAQVVRPSEHWIEGGLLLAAIAFGLLLLPAVHGHERLAFSWIASLADGALSLLTLWTLQRVGAVHWSAQFLLIPLVTILEGVALLRPSLTSRSWVGLLLLAVGGIYLLLPRLEE